MRHPITSVLVLLAACASAPIDYGADEIIAHYWKQLGPEAREELDLTPDGLCTWWSCRFRGYLHKEARTGRWSVERDSIVIEFDSSSPHFFPGATRLTLRRWRGYVYLVPRDHLEWFDANGPDEEFCFLVNGAPTAPPPPYFLTDVPTRRSN